MNNNEYRKNDTRDEEILEYYRRYAKGIITRQELNDIMIAKGCFTKYLDEDLKDKIEEEHEDFIEKVLKLPKEAIVIKAYEIVAKGEIKQQLLNMTLHDKEKAILLDTEDVLDAFYEDWLDTDLHFYEIMSDTIEDSVATATKYYNKQGKVKPKYTLDYFEREARKKGMLEDNER